MDKIYELVGEGVISVLEMERHLNIFVKKQLFSNQPSPSVGNRRFYPSRTDIRNHMYRAVVRFRHSKIDQENLESKIMEWKAEVPDDNFFFRPYVKEADEIPNPTPYDANEDEVKMTSSSYESHTNIICTPEQMAEGYSAKIELYFIKLIALCTHELRRQIIT